jgi:hypothetical protein
VGQKKIFLCFPWGESHSAESREQSAEREAGKHRGGEAEKLRSWEAEKLRKRKEAGMRFFGQWVPVPKPDETGKPGTVRKNVKTGGNPLSLAEKEFAEKKVDGQEFKKI